MFDFFRELFFNIFFEATKEERAEDTLKLLDDRDIKGLVLGDRLVKWVGEPFLKVLLATEDLRHQEVHK